MSTSTKNIPLHATHPGEVLLDELKARGINQKQVAIELNIQRSVLNEIIKGKRSLTADLAILLESYLEIPADYWMRLQSQYDLDLARIKQKNIQRLSNVEAWKLICEYVPTNYLKKNGYLSDDVSSNISTVKDIYKIDSIDGLIEKNAKQHFAMHRKSEKLLVENKNMLAWNMVAQYEAERKEVNSFNFNNLQSLKEELQIIFYENSNTLARVEQKMTQYGIKFVLVNKIEKAPIDGLAFWSGENPAIALTIRHKRIDNLAFTVMHELGHIDLHLRQDKERIFYDLTGAKNALVELEKQADDYAQCNLITESQWSQIISLPEHNDYSIKMVAEKCKINPAIILGRLNHESKFYAFSTTISKVLN